MVLSKHGAAHREVLQLRHIISFDVQSYAKSTSGTFDLYLASENGRLIEWEDHCKERCLKKDQDSIMI